MLFLNPWLLMALAGISIPVIIHLVRRQAAKPVDWGAMRFLMDTLSERRRRMEWEDLLLMAVRCLLLALAALAVARPFIPPDSPTPWSFVLPTVLLGVALLGASFVLATARKRLLARGAALVLLFLAGGMVLMEHILNLRRFDTSGRRDVVMIIDASTSMSFKSGKRTLFEEGLEEAKRIVKNAPRGTSFAVILGGPSPQALSNTPISHRADVLAQLEGLQVVGGTFRAHDALGVATLILSEGSNVNKDIILLTDTQRNGWRFDDLGAWKSMEQAWETLPSRPRLLIRPMLPTPSLRNAGISSISTLRDLTGTDRTCLLRTEVASTGNQPVTPGDLLIEVDGKQIAREPLGILIPGQTQVIETRHRFTTPGSHVITARLSGRDEITGDDRADHVVVVRKAVSVVLVDGNPAGGFFERAAGHTALALAPASALLSGSKAGEDFLMDPVVVAAPDVTAEIFETADVVVLADVTRLPAPIALALADRIASGSGLVVLVGPRADPAFYNAWIGLDGPLLPLQLGEESVDSNGVSPMPNTFRHEALAWAADPRSSDLGGTVIQRWRKSTLRPEIGALAAMFGNGDAFLAHRGYGQGRCVVATCAFDARSGNLPGRTSFVPLVQDLVGWAAGGGVSWNLDPLWSPSVVLDSRSSGGLSASYFVGTNKSTKPLTNRIDPSINFNWGEESPDSMLPRDKFFVFWQAKLTPRITGDYLIEAEADEKLAVKINGKIVLEQSANQEKKSTRIKLEVGKPATVEASFTEDSGPAFARLYWTPPGGIREIIPSSAWSPVTGENEPQVYGAVDPLGRPRKAVITSGRRGRELRIDGSAIPGLYQVNLPAEVRESVTGDNATTPVPVAVRGEIAESRIDPLNEDDYNQLRSRTDVILPNTTDDIMAVLSGRGFGREITRTVAVAALVLLILETALARWVSRSRRAGDMVRVDFGDNDASILEKGGWR